MDFQRKFSEVLEKTYANCKKVDSKNISFVRLKSRIFGDRIISLPFLDTVAFKEINKRNLEEWLLKHDKEKIEIRLSEFDKKYEQFEKVFLSLGFKKNISKGHIVTKLTSEEDLWEKFHKHTRNDIRKARKSLLKIVEINFINELEKFYKLYLKQMKVFGTPQHSFRFFKNCFEKLNENFYGLNCYKDKKLISSVIIFIRDNYAYVSFNVSDKKYRNFRPNDLLYWESIKYCLKNKIRYFDIGQVGINLEKDTKEESLLKFKKKWLGETYEKVHFTLNIRSTQEKKNSLKKFRKMWKRIPAPILKIIGPKIASQLAT